MSIFLRLPSPPALRRRRAGDEGADRVNDQSQSSESTAESPLRADGTEARTAANADAANNAESREPRLTGVLIPSLLCD